MVFDLAVSKQHLVSECLHAICSITHELSMNWRNINRSPTPPNNVEAMTSISRCSHDILERNIVEGARG